MTGEIDGDSLAVLERVQAIFDRVVPGTRCEVWDYGHKIRCGTVTVGGEKIEQSFVCRGIHEQDVRAHAVILKDKLAGKQWNP